MAPSSARRANSIWGTATCTRRGSTWAASRRRLGNAPKVLGVRRRERSAGATPVVRCRRGCTRSASQVAARAFELVDALGWALCLALLQESLLHRRGRASRPCPCAWRRALDTPDLTSVEAGELRRGRVQGEAPAGPGTDPVPPSGRRATRGHTTKGLEGAQRVLRRCAPRRSTTRTTTPATGSSTRWSGGAAPRPAPTPGSRCQCRTSRTDTPLRAQSRCAPTPGRRLRTGAAHSVQMPGHRRVTALIALGDEDLKDARGQQPWCGAQQLCDPQRSAAPVVDGRHRGAAPRRRRAAVCSATRRSSLGDSPSPRRSRRRRGPGVSSPGRPRTLLGHHVDRSLQWA